MELTTDGLLSAAHALSGRSLGELAHENRVPLPNNAKRSKGWVGEPPSIELRRPRVDECAALSALCLRSKAVWGYDAAFLARCREELTIDPAALTTTDIAVATLANALIGVVQIDRETPTTELMKLFVDPIICESGSAERFCIGRSRAPKAAAPLSWRSTRIPARRRFIARTAPSTRGPFRRNRSPDACCRACRSTCDPAPRSKPPRDETTPSIAKL